MVIKFISYINELTNEIISEIFILKINITLFYRNYKL